MSVELKRCPRCGDVLPLSEFAKNRSARDGLQTYCKTCGVRRTREWQIANNYRPPKKPSTPESRAAENDKSLVRKYGMTRAEIDELVREQGGCRICLSQTPKGRNWHVDHDHSCCPGQYTCGDCIRGVLCSECNTGLGKFGDSPEVLRMAAQYLSAFRERRIALTVGTFDLLHPGHQHLFEVCRKLVGDRGRVVVGVNSSEFVQTFKPAPTQTTDERLSMVGSSASVDSVLVNDSTSLREMIMEVSPDFLVIGADWAPPKDYHAQIGCSAEWLYEQNVALFYVDRLGDLSSTNLKARIREA